MPRKPNPYITGPPVSGRSFYGREDIFRFVENTFSSPQQNIIVLWGQRRMGKTSVLHKLPSRLSPGFHPIYFDLLDKAQQSLNEVLYDLAREVAGSLNLDSPPKADFIHDDGYFHERFLPQVYQVLGAKRLLLMFDEFETVGVPPLEGPTKRDVAHQAFFPYIRRRLVSDGRLAFVFVTGRRLDEIDELILSTFKDARAESVSFLEEAEARQLVVEPASGILEYDEEAVGRVISITACHPYLTQLVCFELFSYMEAAGGRTRVTVGDVEAVVDRAIAAGAAGLAWLWDSLPTAERFVLSAVAHAAKEGCAATQDEIDRTLEEYRVPFLGPELIQAPDNLIRWGLLRHTADGYEFVVELLRRWILSEHSLEQAKRELELVSPRAIQLYELASVAHQANKLVRAIRYYRDALAANPNHLQAQLGLAQALFEQGRLEEAITEYERAYSSDKARARDGLIKARQAWAETLEKEGRVDEADQEYETILRTLLPDRNVVEWVANRWITRGRKYLADNRYGKAIAEYEKAAELNVLGARKGLIATRRAWAEALEGDGKADEADQQYKAILSIAPDDDKLKEWVAGCWMARGEKYLGRERYEDAVAEYDRAVALDVSGGREGLIAARQVWAEALEREDKAGEADRQYEAILSIAPGDDKLKEWVAGCWMTRGEKYLRRERYEDAVTECGKAVALDVSGAREGLIATRRTWVEVLEREDKAGEADQQYDAILNIAPDDVRVKEWIAHSLVGRGDRYLEEGRYAEAAQAYDQAESIQPEKQQIVAQRRYWLEMAPDYDRAIGAHKAGDWVAAEKEWAELYRKDPEYARRDGKTVAVLLAEAIEKREGISKRRQRRLILVLSGLAVVVAALILWLGWGSVVTSGQIGAGPLAIVIRTATPITPPTPVPLPTGVPTTPIIVTETATPITAAIGTPTPMPASIPTPTPAGAPMPTPPPIIIVATATPGPTPTPIIIVATATPGPTPTPIIIVATATPGPTPTPIIIVATPTPGPTPTPRFPAPRLTGPENGHKFFEGDATRIILQWEPAGPLAENEWYQVVLRFFKPEIQYTGNRMKETEWLVPKYFHGQANQPERAYYWDVTVVQVDQDPDGKEKCIARSPSSETRVFYWP